MTPESRPPATWWQILEEPVGRHQPKADAEHWIAIYTELARNLRQMLIDEPADPDFERRIAERAREVDERLEAWRRRSRQGAAAEGVSS